MKKDLLNKRQFKKAINEVTKKIDNAKNIVNSDSIKLITSQDIIEGSLDKKRN